MSANFVAVRTCTSLHEAEVVKSILEAEGIEAAIPDEYSLGVQPFLGFTAAGARVVVRTEDLERATAALGAVLEPGDRA